MMEKTAYFNNAATTYPKPETVYKAVEENLRKPPFDGGRGNISYNLIDNTRALITKLFHAPNAKTVFTSGATIAINLILQGLKYSDNATIYITPFEHNAVLRTLYYIQSKYPVNIEKLYVDRENLCYSIERIKEQFGVKKPDIVIINHASNVCGLIAPFSEIFTEAKKYDAVNILDMCQTAGVIDTDLSSGLCDFAVWNGHKTLYSPYGIAGFVCTDNVQPSPLIYGGTGIDSANASLPLSIPERFEPGTPNLTAIAGLNAALNWILETGSDKIHETEKENTANLLKLLSDFDNIRIVGKNCVSRTGIVSAVFDDYTSDEIAAILEQRGVIVRSGLHCSPDAHKFLNTFPAGTVRFSVSYFTSDADFAILKNALEFIRENG